MPILPTPIARVGAALLILSVCPLLTRSAGAADPPSAATGTITGRVFNAATGEALGKARVAVVGTALEAITEPGGDYRLAGVPVGETRIQATYLGLIAQAATVGVRAGGTVVHEFELTPPGGTPGPGGEVVRLKEFNVVADREMSAQAVAMNEQRHAPNLKNVVALGEYGDQTDENIFNFLRFLPGVAIQDDAPGAGSVSVRGFSANNTAVTMDGGDFSSARDGDGRTTVLVEVPMANVSRVEVTKVPTPDMPATGLGGSINLITRNGFETRKPVFSYQVSSLFHNSQGLGYDIDHRSQTPAVSPKRLEPSFNLSYLHPLNRSLAVTASLARTWRYNVPTRQHGSEVPMWDLVNLVQTRGDWENTAQVLETWSGQLGVDWRFSPRDSVSVSYQRRETANVTMGDQFRVQYGAGATGGPNFTQGAATGVGTISQGLRTNWDRLNLNHHYTFKHDHRGDLWRWDAAGSYSLADGWLWDVDRGFFSTVPATLANAIVRGDGIGEGGNHLATRYTARNRAGATVDVYDGGNYTINSATANQSRFRTEKTGGRLNLSRSFLTPVTLTLKAGLSTALTERDSRRDQRTWTFRPNGAADEASRLARRFDVFDEAFNASAPGIYGQPMRWISLTKVYELYRQHPDWFVLNEAQAHQNRVNTSMRFEERISAAYVRTDLRLLQNRLWLATGVRFERTEVEGWGPLNDIFAIYQRNANGDFVRNAAGQRILITTDALAQARLRFKDRGAHAKTEYSGYYPSLNATYNFSDNLVLRAAYARTIGRPEISNIVPGTTISDPEAANPTISVNNPELKPWTADSFDLSLESYFLKDGFGSAGLFQKSVRNFFGAVRTPATPELLALHGLPDDASLLNYEFATDENSGDARIRGLEFNYRQSLTFLPLWARGLQVFANTTRMWLDGSRTADFTSFTPKSMAGGVNFIRSRLYLKLNVTRQALTRRALVAPSATVPAGTYNYLAARTIWSLSGQYSLSRRFALFGAINDIHGGERGTLRYAPGTPEYARRSQFIRQGYYTTLGVKGEF
jgi:iron complex outermembrane receptor protein